MEYRRVGTTGLAVSAVGLGCNNFGRRIDLDDEPGGRRHRARPRRDAVRHRRSLRPTPRRSSARCSARHRDDVIIATKFGSRPARRQRAGLGRPRLPPLHPRGGRASLRRLRTDRIDLYQLHRPDPLTPIEETLAALNELVHEGKVRYIGSSNLAGWQVGRRRHWPPARGGSSPVRQRAERVQPARPRASRPSWCRPARRTASGVLPFFPLANGLLTGKYRRDQAPGRGTRIAAGTDDSHAWTRFDVVDALDATRRRARLDLLDVAIGGLAAQPAVASVIAGATSVDAGSGQRRRRWLATLARRSRCARSGGRVACPPDGPEQFPVIPTVKR